MSGQNDLDIRRAAQERARGKDAAVQFVNALSRGGPIRARIASEYRYTVAVDTLLAAIKLDPSVVHVENVTATDRVFSMRVVPDEGKSLIEVTHIGIPCRGMRDGIVLDVNEAARIGGKNPIMFRSIGPVMDEVAFGELREPFVLAAPCPPDDLAAQLGELGEDASKPAHRNDSTIESLKTQIADRLADRRARGLDDDESLAMIKSMRGVLSDLERERAIDLA